MTTFNLKCESLNIAVASNFLETAKVLANKYEQQTQHKVLISSGSSGKLYLQIKNGAPFDLFLSADKMKPQQLVEKQLGESASLQTYARGKLSLWIKHCPRNQNHPYQSLKKVLSQKFNKFAIANPKLAPYGYASKEFLENQSIYKQLSPHLIYPENIAQVAQLAKLGVVDGALIAHSSASKLIAINKSCLIDLKESDYPAIEQQLVTVSKSQNKALSKDFIAFMNSKAAQSLIKNMGYLLPKPVKIVPVELNN